MPTVIVAEDALRGHLERRIPAILGKPAGITGIQRRRSEYSSSYDAEVVTIQLNTGQQLTLFAKNFGVIRFPKDDPNERRTREVGVYRHLLAQADLGTATFHGSTWDERLGTGWCLLEFVNGSEVGDCGLDDWVATAGWLARLQAYFARRLDRLNACAFLARHDAAFYHSKAGLALGEVGRISERLARRLAPILERHERLVEILANQPRTLVHGSYRPANILVDRTVEPIRICPVDWEMAAVGSPLYDLAYITEGFPPPEVDQFVEAYRKTAAARGIDVPDGEDIKHLLACFHYFMKVHLLSRAGERKLPEEKVADAIQQLEQLHSVIWARKHHV